MAVGLEQGVGDLVGLVEAGKLFACVVLRGFFAALIIDRGILQLVFHEAFGVVPAFPFSFAFEQPEIFVAELRKSFAQLR